VSPFGELAGQSPVLRGWLFAGEALW